MNRRGSGCGRVGEKVRDMGTGGERAGRRGGGGEGRGRAGGGMGGGGGQWRGGPRPECRGRAASQRGGRGKSGMMTKTRACQQPQHNELTRKVKTGKTTLGDRGRVRWKGRKIGDRNNGGRANRLRKRQKPWRRAWPTSKGTGNTRSFWSKKQVQEKINNLRKRQKEEK